MSFVCSAIWTARPGQEETVRDALEKLSPASRAEPGNLYYQAHQNAEEPHVFRIFEVYVDEEAFAAHGASAHFARWALGQAIPALDTRERLFSETLEF
ncbi:putative quinol monooxygenase [Microbacterium sp. SORGH_AS_0862]|uniref:putative quinol monooxygenase n=1 Tax=Microbacterium sp. SORGH_AS_0862 TaxID=3041789 RepID=UPI002790B5D4|nr:putative quinol monooxygenase [Microbacterium sp. SORGH_AS_0862]MDQ1204816.1 quinol monooxygenase YgiN [Microbacterium sp. SORGH_AS_0862]